MIPLLVTLGVVFLAWLATLWLRSRALDSIGKDRP